MKRIFKRLVVVVAGLVAASAFAKQRKATAYQNAERGESEWPPLAMAPTTKAASAPETTVADSAADPTTGWVAPDAEGDCPISHPVKGKVRSGIYHVEGNTAWERTNADRCYLSPEAAEADGYRAAKT
ncbi:MAG: sunset domain-containing protein [Acidimicrobiales bacterium]|jgi:hypothetical protein